MTSYVLECSLGLLVVGYGDNRLRRYSLDNFTLAADNGEGGTGEICALALTPDDTAIYAV